MAGPTVSADPLDVSVVLSWTEPQLDGQSLVRYEIQHCEVDEAQHMTSPAGGGCVDTATETSSTTPSIVIDAGTTVGALTPGTDYKVRVRVVSAPASDVTIDGEWSAWLAYHTHNAPEAPGTPTVTSKTSTVIMVQWSVPVHHGAGVSSYEIEVDSADISTVFTASFIDTGLVPVQERTYRVRAYNSYGWGGWSAVLTEASSPTAPTLAQAPSYTTRGQTTMAYTWGVATPNGFNVTGYRASISSVGGGTHLGSPLESTDLTRFGFDSTSPLYHRSQSSLVAEMTDRLTPPSDCLLPLTWQVGSPGGWGPGPCHRHHPHGTITTTTPLPPSPPSPTNHHPHHSYSSPPGLPHPAATVATQPHNHHPHHSLPPGLPHLRRESMDRGGDRDDARVHGDGS